MESVLEKIYDSQWQTEVSEEDEVLVSELYSIIVWNDDVNTFDWVIESLCDVCAHNELQAEQCALIIHYNGKCEVKRGEYEVLKPQAEELLARGISATIV